jgi:hypothetical protein
MTYGELLAKIDYDIEGNPYDEYMSALRAVVKLHEPVQSYMFDEEACSHCSSEEDRVEILYPCQTIQAIEKELNGY